MIPNVMLSTGRIIAAKPEDNGSHRAYVLDDEAASMTQAEWEEYCNTRRRITLRADLEAASTVLAGFPRHPNGMVLEDAKRSVAFKAASRVYDKAFAALRAFNARNKPPRISMELRMRARELGAEC